MGASKRDQPGARQASLPLAVRVLLQALILPFILGPCLSLPAGRLDWPAGWALLIIYILGTASTVLVAELRDPGLARERITTPAGVKAWDRTIRYFSALVRIQEDRG